MFTGIIEKIGKVVLAAGSALTVDLGGLANEVKIGDSVAVNGLCLTASKIEGSRVSFDVSPESVKRSTIGSLRVGDDVNIELAMLAGGRFGGHIVQGHVDGTGKVKSVEKSQQFWEISFEVDENLADEMVEKGSVAINGISLTIAGISGGVFSVAVIPVTLADTTLGKVKVGDRVNIETDIIGKMVKKQLSKLGGGSGGLTIDKLKEMGY